MPALRPAVTLLAALFALSVMAVACGTGDGRSATGLEEPDRPNEVGDSTTEVDAGEATGAEVRLLAVGDSILAWNDDESIPDLTAEILNRQGVAATVENRAVGGACLVRCGRRPTITDQYATGDWTHVLVTGGGNDVGDDCRSPDSSMTAELDAGSMVDLIDRATADGAVVLLEGYAPAVDPTSWWAGCASFGTLNQRYAAFAAARDDVVFVDAATVAGPSTPEFYDDDIHPSVEGGQAIAKLVARAIVDHGT